MTLASVLQARTQAVQVPPQHVWEGMAQYTPEAAELACHSLDIASAESYFARVRVNSGGTLSPFKCACLDCVLPNVTPLQASAQGCNDRQRELNVSADMSMYILQSGAASRDAQQGAAQRTARLALTMAAAAAADSAAGTLHASTPQPTSQAAQGPLPLHTLAGLPTGPAAALPGSSAVPAARPAAVGPAQGLLGSLGMPQAMPASFGSAAAQHPSQAPSALQGLAAPLLRATAGLPVQGAAAMQSASMLRPGIPPGLGSQAPSSYGMNNRGPILGTGLPSMPGHGTAQPPQWSGAAGGPGILHRMPPPSDVRQYSSAPGNPSLAHTAGLGQPVSAVQPQRPAMAPPVLPSPGQLPVSASLSNVVRHSASNSGPPGLSSHAGVPASGSSGAQQGASQHRSGALQLPVAMNELDSRLQHPQKVVQQPQSAPSQTRETERSHMQRSAKHSESSLADSSGNTLPGMNGHHNRDQPRNIPNGVYEKGTSREGVSREHEHARPEHGHAASKGRPPEVEAGYS